MARGLVAARLAGTVILLSAVGSGPSKRTRALVGVKCGQSAGASILTWTGVTGIGHSSLTQGVLEAQGTLASKGRSLAWIPGWSQDTGSSILANLFSRVTMVSILAVLSSVIRRTFAISFSSEVDFTLRSIFARVWRTALEAFRRPNQQS